MTAPEGAISFGHVGLNCCDVEVTESFYSRLLGFRREKVVRLGEKQLVFIRAGDVVLELFAAAGTPQLETGTGPTTPGFRHLALQVEDVATILTATAGSAEITLGPLDLSQEGLSPAIAWLRDPDGRILEIYQ